MLLQNLICEGGNNNVRRYDVALLTTTFDLKSKSNFGYIWSREKKRVLFIDQGQVTLAVIQYINRIKRIIARQLLPAAVAVDLSA